MMQTIVLIQRLLRLCSIWILMANGYGDETTVGFFDENPEGVEWVDDATDCDDTDARAYSRSQRDL